MGVTRLKRKDLRNKSKANNRVNRIKQITAKPVIKNVDVEAIKAEFAKDASTKSTTKAKKAATAEKEAPAKAEKKEEKVTEEKVDKKEQPSEKSE